MKKGISLLLITSMFIGLLTTTASAAKIYTANITVHKGYGMLSDNTVANQFFDLEDAHVATQMWSDGISISGDINGVKYNAQIQATTKGLIASEMHNNFSVISLVYFDDFARMVLLENQNNDIVYIDIRDVPEAVSALTYNPNWYADFVEPVSLTEETVPSTRGTGTNTILYKAVYTIFEDVYTEKLTVGHNYLVPASITKGNGGDITTSVNIEDRTTTVALRNGGTRTIDSTSLYIRGCNIKVATDKGNYITELFYQHSAKNCKGNTTSVALQAGFTLSLPGTPLKISGSITTTRSYGSKGESGTIFYTEDNKGSKKLMLANIDFNPTYHASYEDPTGFSPNGDQFTAKWTVFTDSPTVVTTRNAFNITYSYTLESTGNIAGTGTPAILSQDKHFNQTVYYDVK